jgi:hypothetical protein
MDAIPIAAGNSTRWGPVLRMKRIKTMTRAEIEASFRRALGVKDEKPDPPSITHSHRCPHQGCGTWKCINADAICTLPEVSVCPPCDEGEVLLKK